MIKWTETDSCYLAETACGRNIKDSDKRINGGLAEAEIADGAVARFRKVKGKFRLCSISFAKDEWTHDEASTFAEGYCLECVDGNEAIDRLFPLCDGIVSTNDDAGLLVLAWQKGEKRKKKLRDQMSKIPEPLAELMRKFAAEESAVSEEKEKLGDRFLAEKGEETFNHFAALINEADEKGLLESFYDCLENTYSDMPAVVETAEQYADALARRMMENSLASAQSDRMLAVILENLTEHFLDRGNPLEFTISFPAGSGVPSDSVDVSVDPSSDEAEHGIRMAFAQFLADAASVIVTEHCESFDMMYQYFSDGKGMYLAAPPEMLEEYVETVLKGTERETVYGCYDPWEDAERNTLLS